jgi:hypothetical protein
VAAQRQRHHRTTTHPAKATNPVTTSPTTSQGQILEMTSTAIFKARAANRTVKHHPRSLSANEKGVSAMASSRASVRALRLVHTLHDMAEHVRSDTESLTLKLPSEMASIVVDAELLVVLPTLPGTIAFH